MQFQEEGLEKRLADAESAANALLKTAEAAILSIKAYRRSSQQGDLREMHKAMEAVEENATALKQQSITAKELWNLNEEEYLSSPAFRSELIELAKQESLDIFQQDGRLYCFPLILRIIPNDRAILINKQKERRLRPSLLIKCLKELQKKPPRFKPEIFLEVLFSAYSKAVTLRKESIINSSVVVTLSDIYNLLTPLPGQSKEYTQQEFARDMYSLDRSGITKTKDGYTVSFPASTGTKSADSTIMIVTPSGQEKKYYGISFTASTEEQAWP